MSDLIADKKDAGSSPDSTTKLGKRNNQEPTKEELTETLRRIRDHGRELGVGWCIQIANLALEGSDDDL